MIVTLEEAKAKWCPMVRLVIGQGYVVTNRNEPERQHTNCIADQCMLFTFVPDVTKEYLHGQIVRRGYCGLVR